MHALSRGGGHPALVGALRQLFVTGADIRQRSLSRQSPWIASHTADLHSPYSSSPNGLYPTISNGETTSTPAPTYGSVMACLSAASSVWAGS